MKQLLILIFFILMAMHAEAADCNKHPLFCQIKDNNPHLSTTFAMELSDTISKAAKKHKIPANIYTAILMQESSYNVKAKAMVCGLRQPSSDVEACIVADFGMSQINYKTAESYEFDLKRLTTDIEYSVDAGAKVLSWFHRRYSKREHDWYCRYNVGTRPKRMIKTACRKYIKLVNRYL